MITSADPYIITTETTIETDPKITTNGVTDEGRIYRNPSNDGPFATWAFTATSDFDAASGINSHFGVEGVNPVAAFKFSELYLAGDPSISTGGAGPTNLALISVGDLENGGASAFTFGNLDAVLLATQAGSITLNDGAFADIPELYFYARGTGSNLTLGASVTRVDNEILQAEHDVQVNGSQSANAFTVFAGHDYLAGTGSITVGSIDIRAGNNIGFTTAQYPYGDSSGQSVTLDAGNVVNINSSGDMSVLDRAGFVDVTGATINVFSLDGEGTMPFSFSSGADVTFHAGAGGFNSGSIGYDHPSDQFSIFSGGDITLYYVTGAKTLTAGGAYDSEFETSTQTLSADTTINVRGFLTAAVSVNAGSTISVFGDLTAPTVNAGGDITANGISVQDGTATGGGAIIAGDGGITPFLASGNGPGVKDTLTATSIQTTGGINFNGSLFDQLARGGTLTLNSTGSQAFNISSTGNIQGAVDFNGADAALFGSDGDPASGGDGGVFVVNAAGDITVDTSIEATTGRNSGAFASGQISGQGGRVELNSEEGLVSVNGRIEVSSREDAGEGGDPVRRSASGGEITLHTDRTAGAGLTVGSDGQLLSLLASAAPGPGGSILLSTKGADIVVNGTVQADRGTVTLDQNDPAGAIPAITLDGATVRAATFDINGSGDLAIGPNNSTAINISGGTWNVAHDISLNAANTTFGNSFAVNATAGNAINFTGGNSDVPVTLRFPLSGDTTFTAGSGGINAEYTNIESSGSSLNLVSAGGISANAINFTDFIARGSVHANGGALNVANDLGSGDVSALTDITVGGNVLVGSISAGGALDVTGRLAAFGQISGDSSIDAGTLTVSSAGVVSQGTVTADTILPFIVGPGGAAQHNFITAATVIAPNGIDFSGNQYNGIDQLSSGGNLTINADTITFGSGGIGSANFNGADVGGFGDQTNPTVAGDGGTLVVNTTSAINVDADIEAMSGLEGPSPTPSGAGGKVTLNSTGEGGVKVNSRIQVSSATPSSTIAPGRRSASGGNITLKSGATSNVAVSVTSSGQLLSLLSNAAPGPGGKITILAGKTGANNSQINIKGVNTARSGTNAASAVGTDTIRADRGTVDIRHAGDSGIINLTDAVISADVVKVATMGKDGALNIGGGLISADSALRLYSQGSNGTINFLADVTLSGPSSIIAANKVSISDNVIVTINGNNPASVYTNVPNYSVTNGGNNTSPAAGVFGGAGANTSPFADRPPLDPP